LLNQFEFSMQQSALSQLHIWYVIHMAQHQNDQKCHKTYAF